MGYINLNEEFKDNGLKFIVYILAIVLLLIIITLSIIIFRKIGNNEHVKFLGFEFNIPNPQTVDVKEKSQEIQDPLTKKLENPITKPKINKPIILTSKKPKLIDSVVETTINKQPIIQAKNVNTGTNLGQVGDNYISNERQLTEPDKINLLNFIETLKKESNINPVCLNISSTPNSNGGKIASQITDFLIEKGYKLQSNGIAFPSNGTIKGIEINIRGNCLNITVGTL